MDPEAVDGFGFWLAHKDWAPVFEAEGSSEKAAAYEAIVMGGVAHHFPLITTRRKDTDPPWINDRVRRRIRRRCCIYKEEGRSVAWKKLKKANV